MSTVVDGAIVDCATLSYKWGPTQKYVTNRQNLSAHKHTIPIKCIPKAFEDVVVVAHLLGYSYIWIDALSIVQDSKEDKHNEIEKMDAIY
jgi:hypothetical protein